MSTLAKLTYGAGAVTFLCGTGALAGLHVTSIKVEEAIKKVLKDNLGLDLDEEDADWANPIFDEIDKDGNGVLTQEEVEEKLNGLIQKFYKVVEDECRKLREKFGRDSSSLTIPLPPDDKITKVVKGIVGKLDADKDGKIDKKEWAKAAGTLQEMFSSIVRGFQAAKPYMLPMAAASFGIFGFFTYKLFTVEK